MYYDSIKKKFKSFSLRQGTCDKIVIFFLLLYEVDQRVWNELYIVFCAFYNFFFSDSFVIIVEGIANTMFFVWGGGITCICVT